MQHWLERVITRPVEALQKAHRNRGQRQLCPDRTVEWNNELGDIGRGINQLAENVDSLMTRRVEDERRKQELEYRMLQNEVNPHFIYNTLNSIRWMATIQHAPGIAEMVTAFARLTKASQRHPEAGAFAGGAGIAQRLLLPSSGTATAATWRLRSPALKARPFAGTA